jgi:hypothetical protein
MVEVPFLWVLELSLASATSFSHQQLTTTEPQQSYNPLTHLPTPHRLTDFSLVPLIISWHGPYRKHRSSVAVQLLGLCLLAEPLPSNGSTCHNIYNNLSSEFINILEVAIFILVKNNYVFLLAD